MTCLAAPFDAWMSPYLVHAARLQLFPCTAQAAPQVVQLVSNAGVAVFFYAEAVAPFHAEASFWQQREHGWHETGCFNLVACRHDSAKVVGFMQFTRSNLAFAVAPQHWQQGLGHEMVAAGMAHYRPMLKLGALETSVRADNIASRRILERNGFSLMGRCYCSAAAAGQANLCYLREDSPAV